MECPGCKNHLLKFTRGIDNNRNEEGFLIPFGQTREPLSNLIPKEYSELYNESSAVLNHSPRASAALSRTCLELLLTKYGKAKQKNLFDKIEHVINLNTLSSETNDLLNVIRKMGNVAVHSKISEHPGEIIKVEFEDAEWCLDILDLLFDNFIIKSDKNKKKLEGFNKKYQIKSTNNK